MLVREPLTKTGEWPIVALGTPTVRVYVEPPAGPTGDASEESSDPTIAPSREWFIETGEVIGDAAMSTVSAGAEATSRVDSLLSCLITVPDHEKLHQALGEACREAARGSD